MVDDVKEIGGVVIVGVVVLLILQKFANIFPEQMPQFVAIAVATVAAIAILLADPPF